MNACHIYPYQHTNIDKRLLFRFSIFCTKMNIFSFSSAFVLFEYAKIHKKAPHFTTKSLKRIKMNLLLLNGYKVTYIFIANIHKKRSVFTNRAFKLFPNKEKYEVTYKQLICFHFSKVQKLIEFICVFGFFGEIITLTALTPYLMKRNRFGSL